MSLLTAKEGLARQGFQDHWGFIHGPMIAQLPGVRGYTQNKVEAELHRPDANGLTFRADGVVELYFDCMEDMHAAFASQEAERVRPDEENFLGTSSGYSIVGDTKPRASVWPGKLIVVLGQEMTEAAQNGLRKALYQLEWVQLCEWNAVGDRFGAKAGPTGPQPAASLIHILGYPIGHDAAEAVGQIIGRLPWEGAYSIFRVREECLK